MEEKWQILWRNPNYVVSTHGRIMNFRTKFILTPWPSKKGYLLIRVEVLGAGVKNLKVHRLVAEAFIPNPENKPDVNHKDLDKSNNHIENLEWNTNQENQTHGRKAGAYRSREVITQEIADEIRALSTVVPVKGLARRFQMAPKSIRDILQGKSWKR